MSRRVLVKFVAGVDRKAFREIEHFGKISKEYADTFGANSLVKYAQVFDSGGNLVGFAAFIAGDGRPMDVHDQVEALYLYAQNPAKKGHKTKLRGFELQPSSVAGLKRASEKASNKPMRNVAVSGDPPSRNKKKKKNIDLS